MISKLDGKNINKIVIENNINIVNDFNPNLYIPEITCLKKEIKYLKQIIELLKFNSN